MAVPEYLCINCLYFLYRLHKKKKKKKVHRCDPVLKGQKVCNIMKHAALVSRDRANER